MTHLNEHIVINSSVMLGKPVIKGTGITVENIVGELASGYSMEDVLEAHPRLTRETITAALQYAGDL